MNSAANVGTGSAGSTGQDFVQDGNERAYAFAAVRGEIVCFKAQCAKDQPCGAPQFNRMKIKLIVPKHEKALHQL
ncbi:MAG: hypothetical protein QHJ82_14765 [Verrucomicrobiota bacterium]|nr:hypothetical protein [Verrucomicrobiota bacterium]